MKTLPKTPLVLLLLLVLLVGSVTSFQGIPHRHHHHQPWGPSCCHATTRPTTTTHTRPGLSFRQQPQSPSFGHGPLYQSTAANNGDNQAAVSPLWQDISKLLKRTSWFSWWVQTILTVISCTILLFAGNATQGKTLGAGAAPSFFLSGLGLTVSLVSILWTWGNGTRLSRRLLRNKQQQQDSSSANPKPGKKFFLPATPHDLLRRAVRVQVSLNLVGLFLTLLAAEEIVGSLALKVLTAGNLSLYGATAATPAGLVQPLDILIVQANTNTLLSHFCSLTSSLYLADRTRILEKQQPPTDENGTTPTSSAPSSV